jgi:hypothetical protein
MGEARLDLTAALRIADDLGDEAIIAKMRARG